MHSSRTGRFVITILDSAFGLWPPQSGVSTTAQLRGSQVKSALHPELVVRVLQVIHHVITTFLIKHPKLREHLIEVMMLSNTRPMGAYSWIA
jgi:hypothetical protein